MHKMIRSAERSISARFRKALIAFNIPSAASAVVLIVTSLVIIPNMSVPGELYKMFFAMLYITAAYSFAVTLIISIIATLRLRGHEKYTYMEILGEQMVVSEYAQTVFNDRELTDYRRLWVFNLSDVEQVKCTRTKVIIKAKARKMEQRADWLSYTADEMGRAVFDYRWFNFGGSEDVDSIEIRDNYFYAERAAQRIIFCSERQREREFRREEFRRRMLEIAGRPRKGRRKKKERVFRGYEIERKF